METTPTLRVHGKLEGRGTAYDGERPLAEVEYAIKEVEETNVVLLRGGVAPDSGAGQRNFYGILKSPHAGVLAGYVGVRLALRLHDGRALPFTVVKVLAAHVLLIQGLGDFR